MIFAYKTAKRKGVLAFYGNIWCVFLANIATKMAFLQKALYNYLFRLLFLKMENHFLSLFKTPSKLP
jgi:hypothetical protein